MLSHRNFDRFVFPSLLLFPFGLLLTSPAENNLYIFGGLGKNKIYSDVCMFDVEKDAWTKIMLPGTPKARFGHTASACGNR